MRLIDADALLEVAKLNGTILIRDGMILAEVIYYSDALDLITNAPTVDREEQDKLAGWVSVPIEPTEEMLKAGCEAGLDFKTLMDDAPYSTDLAVYKAMINQYINE